MAFVCAGMIIGRMLPRLAEVRAKLLAGGLAALAVTYAINAIAAPPFSSPDTGDTRWATILSTRPFDHGLLYTIGTLGSSVAAFCIVSWIAERARRNVLVVALQRAGQLTLTLYVLHVLMFLLIVDHLGWIRPFSLSAALAFAGAFWVGAIALGAWWQRLFGQGPLERVYRRFGG
jgi:uncharacterized protein